MKKVYLTLAFIFVLCLLLPMSKVFAAGSITVGGASSATIGNNFNVTVNLSGDTFGTAGGYFKFDASKVSYVSSSGATYNSANGRFGWTDSTGAGKSTGTILTLTFKAIAEGPATFSITGQEGMNVDASAELNPGTSGRTVTINPVPVEVPKSTIAYLKGITTTPSGYSPKFNKDTLSYSMNVGKDVTEVKISATKEDSKSTYSVSGNKNLKAGKNTIKITVTAEDKKTKKTYTITVNKEAGGEEPVVETPEVEVVPLGLKSLEVKDVILSPVFGKDIMLYTCEVESNVDRLEITALADVLNIEDATIEILGNENLKPGENTITILVKSKDGETIVTYQLMVNKKEEVVAEENSEQEISDEEKDIKIKTWIVIGSILGIIFVTSGLNIILYLENMKLSEGNIDTQAPPEFKYQSFTDETNFGNSGNKDDNKRGKHL